MTEEHEAYSVGELSGDPPELTDDELREVNGKPWDGNRRIESPLHPGDYLLVADKPRLSMEEWESFWDFPFGGQTTIAQREQLGIILAQIFTEWRLSGKDGKPIPPPSNPLAWRALLMRDFIWLYNRVLKVIQTNPLA